MIWGFAVLFVHSAFNSKYKWKPRSRTNFRGIRVTIKEIRNNYYIKYNFPLFLTISLFRFHRNFFLAISSVWIRSLNGATGKQEHDDRQRVTPASFSVYWGSLWGAVEENGPKHLKFSEPLCLQISSPEESWTAPSDLSPCNGPQIRAPQPKWSSITLLLQGSFKDTCMLLTLWQCIIWEVQDQFHVLQTRGREWSLQKPKRNLIGRRGGEQELGKGAETGWSSHLRNLEGRPASQFCSRPLKPVTGTWGVSSVSWHQLWQHPAKEKQDLPESAKEKVKPVSFLLLRL